jgi:hypothetical protein
MRTLVRVAVIFMDACGATLCRNTLCCVILGTGSTLMITATNIAEHK